MGSQNSFYYFVIWLIKWNDFDSYEKIDNHFVSINDKDIAETTISAQIQVFGAFCLNCIKINPFNRKTLVFSRICRFFVCTDYFGKHMMCIGIKIFIFEEEFIPYIEWTIVNIRYIIWRRHLFRTSAILSLTSDVAIAVLKMPFCRCLMHLYNLILADF